MRPKNPATIRLSPLPGAALFILCLISGCSTPIKTDNRVKIDGPVETRVIADLSPVSSVGPVRPVWVVTGDQGLRVALLDVDGLLLNTPFVGPLSLGENPVALFREKLDAIEADPNVRAVVLRINSPGGGMAASTTMRSDLMRFKARSGKPVGACLMDHGCGGAYYLASAADQIVAGPATVTGGIGVILNLYNLRDLMAQYNVLPQLIKAGKNVDIGSSARAQTDEEKAIFQTMADEFHSKMKDEIARSRPGLQQSGDATSVDGRIFTGKQALERGLVDRIGELDEAFHVAAWMAYPPNQKPAGRVSPAVCMYRRPNDPAHSPYAVSANIPLQGTGLLPNLPGLDRSKMPTFLSLWQPELTMEKLSGK